MVVLLPGGWGGLGDRPASLSPDASMSVKPLETGAGGNQVIAGGWGGLGDRPASPSPPMFWLLAKLAGLWPTEAHDESGCVGGSQKDPSPDASDLTALGGVLNPSAPFGSNSDSYQLDADNDVFAV